MTLRGDWGDTSIVLPDGNWKNVMTNQTMPGGTIRLSELLREFPVALLTREG